MRQASKRVPDSAEKTVRDIRRATRRHHSAEEKIRTEVRQKLVLQLYGTKLTIKAAAIIPIRE